VLVVSLADGGGGGVWVCLFGKGNANANANAPEAKRPHRDLRVRSALALPDLDPA